MSTMIKLVSLCFDHYLSVGSTSPLATETRFNSKIQSSDLPETYEADIRIPGSYANLVNTYAFVS